MSETGERDIATAQSNPEGNDGVSARVEHTLELLPGYALGVLDPEETEQVARHIQGCRVCRAELDAFERVGSLLPYAAPPQPVPLRVRAALLASIDLLGTSNHEQLVVLASPPSERRSWLRRHPKALALVSVAAMIAIMFGAMFAMGERNNRLEAEIAAIEAEKDQAQRVLMQFPTPVNSRFTTSFVSMPEAENARGKLFIDHGLNSAMILVVDLPQLADDETYVAWMQIYGSTEYARAGILELDDDENKAQLTVEPVGLISSYDNVVITVESDPNTSAPTGRQLMTAAMVPQR
ncbi:MAG: anti-sigma factor [Chloroflexota bacterium]|nr:anti-sigma factor [Chloroflexota bacterium]